MQLAQILLRQRGLYHGRCGRLMIFLPHNMTIIGRSPSLHPHPAKITKCGCRAGVVRVRLDTVSYSAMREAPVAKTAIKGSKKIKRGEFEKALAGLQIELVHMLDWIRKSGHKLVVVFEGRDAAGKRGRA